MLYTIIGDIMKFSVVCEEDLMEYGKQFASNLNASLSSFSDEVKLEDTVILIFNCKFGRTSYEVSCFEKNLVCKNVGIFCYGNTGFDIARLYKRMLKNQSSLLIYSKYFKNLDVSKSCNDLLEKKVMTDGNSFSEKFVGALCRLILGANT